MFSSRSSHPAASLPGHLALVLVLALPAAGQAPSRAPATDAPPGQAPPLRVTTRLVQVSIIVQDKKHQPVTDLTREDFTVFDQGQEQKLSFFSMESRRALADPARSAPSNLFSNRFELQAGVPASVTAILLDGLNTKFEDLAYARMQIIRFLEQLQPEDRVALYTLTTKLSVLHDFTSDAAPLLRMLERAKGHSSHELAASEPEPADTGDADLNDFLNGANQQLADFYTLNRVGRTINAIEAIANHLAGLPGRKNLIWVSSSFPFSIGLDAPMTPANATIERRTFSVEVERAARALNNANLAIYPVDARGLISPAQANPAWSAASRGPARVGRGFPAPAPVSPNRANFDTMNILAERTGGNAFYNTNDIKGSIRAAIDDSRVTYVLGFHPSHGQWDGRFREIKVQIKRPGLHLRYRRGYFAIPDGSLDAKQRKTLLEDAVLSPLDSTSLGLSVLADAVDVPGARALSTRVQIDSRDLTLAPEGDRWVGAVDVFFIQRGRDGQQLKGEVRTVQLRLRRDSYDDLVKNGLNISRSLPLVPQAQQVRVLVRDTFTDAIGSVTISLGKLFGHEGS